MHWSIMRIQKLYKTELKCHELLCNRHCQHHRKFPYSCNLDPVSSPIAGTVLNFNPTADFVLLYEIVYRFSCASHLIPVTLWGGAMLCHIYVTCLSSFWCSIPLSEHFAIYLVCCWWIFGWLRAFGRLCGVVLQAVLSMLLGVPIHQASSLGYGSESGPFGSKCISWFDFSFVSSPSHHQCGGAPFASQFMEPWELSGF